MTKVCIDARLIAGNMTGDSTYWTCLLDAYSKMDVDIQFHLVSNTSKPGNVPTSDQIVWHVLPSTSGRWWSMVKLPLFARKLGCDVLHTQYGLSPLAKNGISTFHDVSFLINPEWFSPRDARLLSLGASMAARYAKRLVTVSNTSAGEIRSLVPRAAKKVVVAHNACPPWIQLVDQDRIASVRVELGLPEKYALTVSTTWARKNHELAVAAMEASGTGLPLVVTGKDGSKMARDGVVATGYVSNDQLSALYSGASLYLCPSLHEGFGIPLLEAMRCGAPVICGTGGALPEVAGNAALMPADYSVDEWSRAIGKLMSDKVKLEAMRQAGFLNEKQFSWEQSAKIHSDLFVEVATHG